MTDNEKYVKRGQALIISDDPQRHEEVAAANRNKVSTPFQYAESLFAALTTVKSMTELGHLLGLNLQTAIKPNHTTSRIVPITLRII